MGEPNENLLASLIVISQIDGQLARIAAERKRIEQEIASNQASLNKVQVEHERKERLLKDKKNKIQQEEKSLKEEQDKLIIRRKALTTLNNYKLQQAAEREIDHAQRQLRVREEALLSLIEENEKLEAESETLVASLAALRESLDKVQDEASHAFIDFDQRQMECLQKRSELVSQVDRSTIALYERIKERHPADAVVPVKENACSGCYMQVAPQITVQISKGDSLVRCRGCGRMLYVPKE